MLTYRKYALEKFEALIKSLLEGFHTRAPQRASSMRPHHRGVDEDVSLGEVVLCHNIW